MATYPPAMHINLPGQASPIDALAALLGLGDQVMPMNDASAPAAAPSSSIVRTNNPTIPVVKPAAAMDDSAQAPSAPPVPSTPEDALSTWMGATGSHEAPEYTYAGGSHIPTQADLDTPFEQDRTALAARADAKDRARADAARTLSDYFTDDAGQKRQIEQDQRVGLARVPGESAQEVARINAQGGIDRQRVANEGLIGAAEAKANSMAGGGKLSAGLAERVAGAQTALGTINELKQLFPKVQGFFTGVGPASGRLSEFLQGMPVLPADHDFNAFSARSATLANSVIKAITGAQMSEQEAVRLMRQIPTTHDKPETWVEKVNALEGNLNDTITNIQNVNRGGGAPVSPQRLLEIAQSLGLDLGDLAGASPAVANNLDTWGVEVQ